MRKEECTTSRMKETFAQIATAHKLRLIMLYGSVARGTETAISDVDIGLLGNAPLTHEDEALITEEIAQATGLSRVEARSLHQTSPLFLYQVMSEGIVLFEDTPTLAQEFRLYAWKISAETKRMRDQRYANTKERIEAYVR